MSKRPALSLRTTIGLALLLAAVTSLPFLGAPENGGNVGVAKARQPVAQNGNGIIEAGESCDDGNLNNGDGCTTTGQIEQQCYDPGNNFSFFVWGDSYTSAGESGVKRLFTDSVSRARYPTRLLPRFWIATGDIPFMDTSTDKLDVLNRQISNTPGGTQNYPFKCPASNGQFPYFVALGNHDVDGYVHLTPQLQYRLLEQLCRPEASGHARRHPEFQVGS